VADGIDAERGISCPSLEQAHLKHLMLRQARLTYVLADHSKLGRTPFAFWAALDRPHTLIVDGPADGFAAPGRTIMPV
jgi:DeoR/GlpR family transcriptional regulator of sugar metabolism